MASTDTNSQNFAVNSVNAVVDYETRLRRASVELSLAAERERLEIAGDLHDNISQDLAIARFKLSKLRLEMGEPQRSVIDHVLTHVSDALTCCRTLSHSLATPSLYKLGLIPALKNLISEFNKDSQVTFSVRFEADEVPLEYETRIILYRVIRELLINVIRHSHADSAELSLVWVNNLLKVVIADDGIGFDAESTLRGSNPDCGLGLFLVRERLLHIGATFQLESTLGKGTVVTLSALINHSPAPETVSS